MTPDQVRHLCSEDPETLRPLAAAMALADDRLGNSPVRLVRDRDADGTAGASQAEFQRTRVTPRTLASDVRASDGLDSARFVSTFVSRVAR